MTVNLTRCFIVAGALLVLGAVNYSIFAKEQVRQHGESVFLELTPVDPRSLMQGDYMALRFQLANAIESSLPKIPGATTDQRAKIVLDERHVATLAPASAAEGLFIRYRIRGQQVWLGTNAYFFAEGSASRFEKARYGEFKLDRDSGEAVLVALRDAKMQAL